MICLGLILPPQAWYSRPSLPAVKAMQTDGGPFNPSVYSRYIMNDIVNIDAPLVLSNQGNESAPQSYGNTRSLLYIVKMTTKMS